MRVLICGDRNWSDYKTIEEEMKELPKDSVIIHGCARGADTLTGIIAKKLGFKVLEFPADWKRYGKIAAPIRNRQMIVEGKPDKVLAFHNNISESKGTANMIKQAKKFGIPVTLISVVK